MVNGNKRGQNLIGVVLTLLVISLLIISGPASAITLSITAIDSTDSLYESELVEFQVSVDIDSGEMIPVQNLTIQIYSADANYSKSCTFLPGGTELEGELCDYLDILPNPSPYGYGYESSNMYGYGYGYNQTLSYGYGNTSFGSGYGYGYYQYVQNELSYNITWNAAEVNTTTTFDVRLDANAQNGDARYTYTKTATSFFTVRDSDIVAPTLTNLTVVPVTLYNSTNYLAELSNISAEVNDSDSGINASSCEYYNGSAWLPADYNGTLGICYKNNISTKILTGSFMLGIRVNDSFSNQANTTSSYILPTVDARNNLTYTAMLGSNTNESDLTEDIVLPLRGKYGTYTNISWHSSNTTFINIDGNVTRPAYGQPHADVELTATFSREGYTM
jgi:hypothetical protein